MTAIDMMKAINKLRDAQLGFEYSRFVSLFGDKSAKHMWDKFTRTYNGDIIKFAASLDTYQKMQFAKEVNNYVKSIS